MFNALILSAGLIWPVECSVYGDLYKRAATVRDSGKPLKEVMDMTNDRRVKLALIHVYERKDMSPNEWYWLAVGVCVGLKDNGITSTRSI